MVQEIHGLRSAAFASDICRAYWKDIDLDLTFGEYNIVHLLASKMGHSLTYRVIYDKLNMRVSLPEAGSRVIGRMCGPQSNASAKSFTTSTRHSKRPKTAPPSGTAGKSQTEIRLWKTPSFQRATRLDRRLQWLGNR